MKKYIIEGIGTYFLVLIIGLTGNPIAIGIGLSILVYMGGHISGAGYLKLPDDFGSSIQPEKQVNVI